MTIMTEIGLLFRRRLMEQIRSPIWLFMGLTTPLLYLALFAPLLKGIPAMAEAGIANVFVPGLLALFALSSSTGIGWIIIHELNAGVVERFRVTPVSRFALLMGNVLKDVVMFLLPALLVIGVAGFAGFDIHAGGLAVLLVLLSLLAAMVSAVSGSLGLILREIGTLAAVVTGLQLPITLLAGVLLPISFGPRWLQVLAHLNPLYYVVEASRLLAGGVIWDGKVLLAFAVIGSLLAITLVWATNVYKKAVA
ncbi:ABC-type polysaccharide/polyol phosphate export systems, permease component [Thermobacillus composti KWC4]|jgi:ABC-2 type transport system permease protein|uniref:Transport permease protein n=1 Tax=Thermobacillus composti (strain DSM 18247 / JCM 13945 / KWC4) TaxID=717605 RepID=L0EGS8_THECK|nr:ABC transporter permease [Thermobacillus composti]AGA59473.1 ABC-type polysaccharide/polyol phosphate export systems, permease component [Thermobacillus composti KWC4]